jgi:hypothetical protein
VTVKYRLRITSTEHGIELSQSNEDKSRLAYRYFVDTCRSEATRNVYVITLRYFMSYLKLPPDAYGRLLDKDLCEESKAAQVSCSSIFPQ